MRRLGYLKRSLEDKQSWIRIPTRLWYKLELDYIERFEFEGAFGEILVPKALADFGLPKSGEGSGGVWMCVQVRKVLMQPVLIARPRYRHLVSHSAMQIPPGTDHHIREWSANFSSRTFSSYERRRFPVVLVGLPELRLRGCIISAGWVPLWNSLLFFMK